MIDLSPAVDTIGHTINRLCFVYVHDLTIYSTALQSLFLGDSTRERMLRIVDPIAFPILYDVLQYKLFLKLADGDYPTMVIYAVIIISIILLRQLPRQTLSFTT